MADAKPASQSPPPQRKQATILFADLSGLTEMSENLDPEEVREIVNRYFESLAAVVARYEGTIDKYIGDCVMAAFGVPVTHQNDAERACQAAIGARAALRESRGIQAIRGVLPSRGRQGSRDTSVSAAAELYERGETALEMLHEDRPQLRNKLKALAIMAGPVLLWFSLVFYGRWRAARDLGQPFHPYIGIPILVVFLILIGMGALKATRWSFLVYPARVRIRSKRKIVDIPFEQVSKLR